jgi:hypothetical protein
MPRVVLVGDRGLLTNAQLRTVRAHPGRGWISALRGPAIRALIESGTLQLSLFDQQHLAEITTPEYPGERLIACFNPLLADERRRKREELLVATERALTTLATAAARRTKTPFTDATLGIKVGRVINHYKMAKHVTVTIAKGRLQWSRNGCRICGQPFVPLLRRRSLRPRASIGGDRLERLGSNHRRGLGPHAAVGSPTRWDLVRMALCGRALRGRRRLLHPGCRRPASALCGRRATRPTTGGPAPASDAESPAGFRQPSSLS